MKSENLQFSIFYDYVRTIIIIASITIDTGTVLIIH